LDKVGQFFRNWVAPSKSIVVFCTLLLFITWGGALLLPQAVVADMRQNCEIGYRIAKSSPDLEPIADCILQHQEHWDGNGYPLGIVDAFDATLVEIFISSSTCLGACVATFIMNFRTSAASRTANESDS